jgi:heme/copper-type cytochrome/quinol oxidase subunit 2
MENKSKKVFVILGIVAVVALIIAMAAYQGRKQAATPSMANLSSANTPMPGSPEASSSTSSEIVDISDAKAQIPGASLITKDNQVVNSNGVVTKTDAMPFTRTAPEIVSIAPDQLPEEVIRLEIFDNSITPSSFKVRASSSVSLAVTSADNKVHSFLFNNAIVGAIAMGLDGGQTKAVTFTAPKPGKYYFQCGIPGHASKGEAGVMEVVK